MLMRRKALPKEIGATPGRPEPLSHSWPLIRNMWTLICPMTVAPLWHMFLPVA
jgi:hypothetical protein